MPRIGIMQGRLLPSDPLEYQVFPSTTWRKEFGLVHELGFESFELLFDADDFEDNPLLNDQHILEIRQLAKASSIFLDSVCADYFRVNGFINTKSNCIEHSLRLLERLVINCSRIGVKKIIIPFLDGTKIGSKSDMVNARNALSSSYKVLKDYDMLLSFETDLNAEDSLSFLGVMDSDNVRIQYDLGNAAGFGFDVSEELILLRKHIAGIHVKDKDLNGNNVSLGTGIVDFNKVLRLLIELGLCNNLILETNMGDNPINLAKQHLKFIKDILR